MLVTQISAVEAGNAINVVRLGLNNQRQWREFVSAVQCSVNYPAAISSLRSSTKWFNDGLAQVHAFARALPLNAR